MKTIRLALAAVSIAGVTALGSTAVQGAPARVDVCHVDDDGGFRLITISERAVRAHVAQGGGLPGDPVPGMEGFEFDATCTPVEIEPAVFAVAYTDVVDDGAGYDPEGDVLISKLVDANRSGAPDAGDQVITDRYPLRIDGSEFGTFGVTEHQVAGIITASADRCRVQSSTGGVFDWFVFSNQEGYQEGDATVGANPAFGLAIFDDFLAGSSDGVAITNLAFVSSQPEGPAFDAGLSADDDRFIDVAFDCGG